MAFYHKYEKHINKKEGLKKKNKGEHFCQSELKKRSSNITIKQEWLLFLLLIELMFTECQYHTIIVKMGKLSN